MALHSAVTILPDYIRHHAIVQSDHFPDGYHLIYREGRRIMKDELINVTTPERDTSGLTEMSRLTATQTAAELK